MDDLFKNFGEGVIKTDKLITQVGSTVVTTTVGSIESQITPELTSGAIVTIGKDGIKLQGSLS